MKSGDNQKTAHDRGRRPIKRPRPTLGAAVLIAVILSLPFALIALWQLIF